METAKFIPIKMLTLNKKTDNEAEKQEIQLRSRSLCHIKLLCKMSCEGFLYQERAWLFGCSSVVWLVTS